MVETTSNVEMAHRIHEHGHKGGRPPTWRAERVEILEAIALAAVAVLTAWSGYQAARWESRSAASYARAARVTVLAQTEQMLAGQDRLYDITTFNSWLDAKSRGDEKLAAMFGRRFRPEYTIAFQAWMKFDPFNSPSAPPGAVFMPEYRSARAEKAQQLSKEAGDAFERGAAGREAGDEYIRITVVLAMVLLLTALSQRFKVPGPRIATLAVALAMLAFSLYWIATFPRA